MKVDKVEYELEMVSGDGMARVMTLAKGAAARKHGRNQGDRVAQAK